MPERSPATAPPLHVSAGVRWVKHGFEKRYAERSSSFPHLDENQLPAGMGPRAGPRDSLGRTCPAAPLYAARLQGTTATKERCINGAPMKTAFSISLVAALAACSATPAPKTKAPATRCPALAPQVSLAATERVNPSAGGEGRPVQVRVYQLSSDAKLRTAGFEEIWQRDQQVLAADLKGVAEYTVYPGETKTVTVKRDPEANYLSMVALFREPQGKDWFVSYELGAAESMPPCPNAATLPVFLDRMQIQDGEGRVEAQGRSSPFGTNPVSGGDDQPGKGGFSAE